jgi:hypothetical protein
MALTASSASRSVSFTFVVLGLVCIAAGQAAMLLITTRAAGEAGEEATRRLLLRLAWLSLVLLCLTLLLLLWAVIRHLRYQFRAELPVKRSKYVNAWALAGERFRLDEADSDEEGEPERDDST